MAGPPAMTDSVTPILLERGLQRDDLHLDVFFTPEAATEPERRLEDVK
jgi:CDP-4-dehydro-6-deoxyglucose reductase/ferredoxin-NAD(P)+ reductase (naphthalene dioxygenase ferredoxin-specific)